MLVELSYRTIELYLGRKPNMLQGMLPYKHLKLSQMWFPAFWEKFVWLSFLEQKLMLESKYLFSVFVHSLQNSWHKIVWQPTGFPPLISF